MAPLGGWEKLWLLLTDLCMLLLTEMLLLVSTAAQTFSPKASPDNCLAPLPVTVALVKISKCFKGVWMQQEARNSHWDGRNGAEMVPRVRRRGFAAQGHQSSCSCLIPLAENTPGWGSGKPDFGCSLAGCFHRDVALEKLFPTLSPKVSKHFVPSQVSAVQFCTSS